MFTIHTPDCEYKTDVEKYKTHMKHLAPGSRVLIKRSDPAGISEALIGNWELNLVSIPVEPYTTPKSVMDFITQDCKPHAIVNCTDNEVIFEFVDGGKLSPVDDHAIFYTSGTTGNPKGVVQTRTGMRSNAKVTAKLHGFNNVSVHMTALPLYHCNAAAMSLFGNYFAGGTVVFLKKFTPEKYFQTANEFGATTGNLVPTMVADLVKANLPWPKSLRYVLTAATALSQEICKNFYNTYGPRLRQGYGLSEGVNFSFTMPLLEDAEFKAEYVDQYPPVGMLVQGEYRLQNEEVQLRGDNIMRCYWNNEQATSDAFTKDGWFRTGDRGEVRGKYLVLTGRFKEIIIKGGDNYSPVMIEDEFRRSGCEGDLAVVATKDTRLGEDIGIVLEKYQPVAISNHRLHPASVRFGPVLRTQTRKPKRNEMKRGLVSKAISGAGYHADRAAAGLLAEKIFACVPYTDQQVYLHEKAICLLEFADKSTPRPVVKKYLDTIEQHLDTFWDGNMSGHEVIRAANAWEELMCSEPMGNYAQLAAEFFAENELFGKDVLEVGAGTGNFTRLVIDKMRGSYIRSDLQKKFLKGNYGTPEIEVDITKGTDITADVVVGVNVFHCVKDVQQALETMYRSVRPGGYLLLAEGGPEPDGSGAWALDLLFGFVDGWWDMGGFRNRRTWLNALSTLPGQEFGYSVYREGSYDCGGLYWIKK